MSVNSEVTCWSQVAANVGGRLQVRYEFKGPRQRRHRFGLPSLTVSMDGVDIRGEVTGEGDPPNTFAQLSARVPGAAGLRLRVYRNYLYPQIGRANGIQDVILGAPHFDRNFIVKSNDAQYARLWLSDKARHLMLRSLDYCFEIDSERVIATSHRADDPGQLEAALRALVSLSNRGRELTGRVGQLARHLGSDVLPAEEPWLAGSPGFAFVSGGRRVFLSFSHAGTGGHRGKSQLLSRLWCRRLTARSDRFVMFAEHLERKERPMLARKLSRCDLGATHPPGFIIHASNAKRLHTRMSERWARLLARLKPLVLSCSESAVELVWSGAVLGEQMLRDAAGLCEYFAVESNAVPSLSPYR